MLVVREWEDHKSHWV